MTHPFARPRSTVPVADIKAQYGVEQVYLMHQNETPLGPSPKVIEAVQREAQHLGYYPSIGDEPLRQALADTWGGKLTPDHFFTACGGFEIIELIAQAYLSPGDEVITTPPTFSIVYNHVIALEQAKVINVPLRRPTFSLDVDRILTAVTPKTRLVMICNPNNPTGTIVTATEIDRLIRELSDDILIMMDEVYLDFVRHSDFPDSVPYVLADRNVILVHSFSKAYGLPGLRLGYGIAKPAIANYIGALQRGYHQNRLALVAGIAALADQAHKSKNVQAVLDGKAWICAQLDQLGVTYWPSETNFILVQTSLPGQQVAAQLLTCGVLVNPMIEGYDDCFRVSTSTPQGNRCFVEGLKQIGDRGQKE